MHPPTGVDDTLHHHRRGVRVEGSGLITVARSTDVIGPELARLLPGQQVLAGHQPPTKHTTSASQRASEPGVRLEGAGLKRSNCLLTSLPTLSVSMTDFLHAAFLPSMSFSNLAGSTATRARTSMRDSSCTDEHRQPPRERHIYHQTRCNPVRRSCNARGLVIQRGRAVNQPRTTDPVYLRVALQENSKMRLGEGRLVRPQQSKGL